MRELSRYLVAAALFVTPLARAEDFALPLVEERVDAVLLVQMAGGESVRVVFLRNGRVLAERWLNDEMQWLSLADDPGGFALAWTDYGQAERLVRFKHLSTLLVAHDPLAKDAGPWWGWNRRMTDLKAPP